VHELVGTQPISVWFAAVRRSRHWHNSPAHRHLEV